MNYVMPLPKSPEVASLVAHRARMVVGEVMEQVQLCAEQVQGQDGFLAWSSLQGQVRGHFQKGRCLWLLVVEQESERVFYYRHRGDHEVFESCVPGHCGQPVWQKTEQLGKVTTSYSCDTGDAGQTAITEVVASKLRWFNLQCWLSVITGGERARRTAA